MALSTPVVSNSYDFEKYEHESHGAFHDEAEVLIYFYGITVPPMNDAQSQWFLSVARRSSQFT
jgi:hypothetical protein